MGGRAGAAGAHEQRGHQTQPQGLQVPFGTAPLELRLSRARFQLPLGLRLSDSLCVSLCLMPDPLAFCGVGVCLAVNMRPCQWMCLGVVGHRWASVGVVVLVCGMGSAWPSPVSSDLPIVGWPQADGCLTFTKLWVHTLGHSRADAVAARRSLRARKPSKRSQRWVASDLHAIALRIRRHSMLGIDEANAVRSAGADDE